MDEEQFTVYVPFEVETESGSSEVLVRCDVTEVSGGGGGVRGHGARCGSSGS